MKKVLCLAVLVAGAIGVSAAQAIGPSTRTTNGHVLGMVLPHKLHAAEAGSGIGPLLYNGGPVMHTSKTYAIYWSPPGYTTQSGYSALINQYFTDVAADSGKKSNVYYTGTQYYDGASHVQYSSSFGGSYTDTSPLPASGCVDLDTSVCLTDAQLQTEIKKDIAANGWTAGPSTEFFLFTAKGIGSCSGTDCAFTQFCAYHSSIGTGSSEILYSNMPYADTVKSGCDGGQHPNANAADATINVTSHEHNETITDPRGNAWYDLTGEEDGDKCAWIFGALQGTPGAEYNQTINGHHYFLQEEYSNRDSGCVQTGL
jgi:serine protease